MTPNVELLLRTLEHIEADPEHWNQRQWRTVDECGTSYCFAGWACRLSGIEWDADADDDWHDDWVRDPDTGERLRVPTLARRLLGVSRSEGEWLFNGGNTLDELRRKVEKIIQDAESSRADEP